MNIDNIKLQEPPYKHEKSLAADAACAVAAAKRRREHVQAAWEYAREQAVNPHRLSQLSTDEQWAAWSKRSREEIEACGVRRVAAASAL